MASVIASNDSFDKFLTSAISKFENLIAIQRPLNYVGSLYDSIIKFDLLEKLDKKLFDEYMKECSNSDDKEIFTVLLKFANYLASIVRTLGDHKSMQNDKENVNDMNPQSQNQEHIENVDQTLKYGPDFDQKIVKDGPELDHKIVKDGPELDQKIVKDGPEFDQKIINDEPDFDQKIVNDGQDFGEPEPMPTKNSENFEYNENNIELTHNIDSADNKVYEVQLEEGELNENEEIVTEKGEEVEIEEETYDDDIILTENDIKVLAKMEKYDKLIAELNLKIKATEKAELTYDDLKSSKSKYVQHDYKRKKRFNLLVSKLRKLCKANPKLVEGGIPKKSTNEFGKPVTVKKSKHKEINDMITLKLKKIPEFPNYFDVLEWVSEANTESNLNLNKESIEGEAKGSFQEIGRILKNRRKKDMESLFENQLESYQDEPKYDELNKDTDLMEKLSKNKNIAIENEQKVIAEFVQKEKEEEKEAEKNGAPTIVSEENSDTLDSETEDEITLDSDNEDINDKNSQVSGNSSENQENKDSNESGESEPKTEIQKCTGEIMNDINNYEQDISAKRKFVPEFNGIPKKAKLVPIKLNSPVKDVKPNFNELEKFSSMRYELHNDDSNDSCIILD